MRTEPRRGSVLLGIIASGASAVLLAASVTGVQAQVSVSSSGSPSYSQPIAVPPGIGGMQPNLSLMYAGGGVNGPVGHGWSVQGVSMITRCPATRYVDGQVRGVKFDQSDKLCLDGQRLIQTDATGAASPGFPQADDARGLSSGSREYRTEKDSFARIRAYGIANGSDANGPAYFKVWTKAGQIYEYGAAPSADANTKAAVAAQGKNIVMVWAVARVSDVVGNYINFKYEVRDVAWGSGLTAGSPILGREWNIAEIQYTGNSINGQVPANKVIFRYTDRTLDKGEAYQQGSKNVSIRRLDAVDTYVNSPNNTVLGQGGGAALAKRVKLVYDNSGITKRARLVSIKDCADAAELKCLPPTNFNYAAGGNESFAQNTAFHASALSTTALMANDGTMGVEVLDFDGDGKSDLLRWSQSPANNRLYKSNGDGSFTQVTLGQGAGQFNLTQSGDNIFSQGGCVASLLMDFNGDGLTDIFTYRSQGQDGLNCSSTSNYLYISKGDGGFERRNVTGATLLKNQGTVTNPFTCGWAGGEVTEPCNNSQSDTFYVLDIDGDGLPDIVKTKIPAYTDGDPDPCLNTICTQIHKGDGTGQFTEITTPVFSVRNKSLYQWPAGESGNRALAQQRYVVDVDGDGFTDIVLGVRPVGTGSQTAWRSLQNGDFEAYTAPTDANDCKYRADFNGDGRGECLWPSSSVTSSKLTVSTGAQLLPVYFNLAVSGGPGLKGSDKGVRLLDANGDGRTDILRWHDTPSSTLLYLSNGDGSFTQSTSFDLNTSARRLVTSGGSYDFVVGDFTGNGSMEILRLRSSPSTGEENTNQLYTKADPTAPDQLQSVISPTGIKSSLTYKSLANSLGRYTSDLVLPAPLVSATYPIVNLTIPGQVVVTLETDVGVGSNKVQTEFAYKGLKAALDGRGMLGFRQSIQQNTAPNGDALSVWTDYLLDEPYAGVARSTQTRKGPWSSAGAQLLSTTTNTYCDRTSATDPGSATDAVPCATTARVRRPYLRRSVEQGSDLDGTALPSVTTVNTYNDLGDPTTIAVTTTGTVAGVTNQDYTKTSVNEFCAPDSAGCPNKITGDNWILGRLMRSTVTNTAPNLMPLISASAGNAPGAASTSGNLLPILAIGSCSTLSPTTSPTAATKTCTLSNSGQLGASSISYTTASGTTITGPTSCGANTTCGTLTVTSGTAAGSYTGTLTATASGHSVSTPISLEVSAAPTPPQLTLTACSSVTPTVAPTPATLSCSVGNYGQTAASSITYSTAAGTTVSGPTSCSANSTCGTVTVTTGTGAAAYNGTLTATPNAGSSASQAVSLSVLTPPALNLTGCSSATPTTAPTAATMSCTVSNSGQSAASSLSYSAPSGTTVSGPTGACAAGATCGTVIVTTGTSPGTYSGTLTATPSSGSAATASVGLTVAPGSASLVASPASLAFGNVPKGSMKWLTLTMTNTSPYAAALNLSHNISYSGNYPTRGAYLHSGGTCSLYGGSLAAGGSCTVVMEYEAFCTVGARNGTLTISGSNFTSMAIPLTASTSHPGYC
jgi:hypothetical protein